MVEMIIEVLIMPWLQILADQRALVIFLPVACSLFWVYLVDAEIFPDE
jgi:hypothetical protein